MEVLKGWKRHAKVIEPEALVFATRSGKPISPNNVLRRWVFPACATLGLRNATWNTFRRTYSTWAHEKGVPGKILAQLIGHTRVDTTLNIYAQVLNDSVRTAAGSVGSELFKIVQSSEAESEQIH